MNSFITTYTKKHIDPLNPNPNDIDIIDIAHVLSFMTCANGHFPQFYSVCQHSVACCEEALLRDLSKREALLCLLHDASEAYIADIIRPVKQHIAKYYEIEEKLQNTIYLTFTGSLPDKGECEIIREIDDSMLYHEFMHFTNEKLSDTEPEIYSSPNFDFVPFEEAEKKFLALFRILK